MNNNPAQNACLLVVFEKIISESCQTPNLRRSRGTPSRIQPSSAASYAPNLDQHPDDTSAHETRHIASPHC